MGGQVVGAAFEQQSSTPLFALGTIAKRVERGCTDSYYMYVLAGATLTANLIYTVDPDTWTSSDALTSTVAASTEVHQLIVPQIAVTDEYYFWAFVGPGEAVFTSAGAITAQKKLYTSATAGKIDDNSSSTVLIPGLVAYDAFTSAVTGTCHASTRLYVSN
jgi:hypothetical protein